MAADDQELFETALEILRAGFVILCPCCDRSFNENDMPLHLSEEHIDVNPLECGVCREIGENITESLNHVRVHTEERPYHCFICARQRDRRGRTKKVAYTQRSTLLHHWRTSHMLNTQRLLSLVEVDDKQKGDRKEVDDQKATAPDPLPKPAGLSLTVTAGPADRSRPTKRSVSDASPREDYGHQPKRPRHEGGTNPAVNGISHAAAGLPAPVPQTGVSPWPGAPGVFPYVFVNPSLPPFISVPTPPRPPPTQQNFNQLTLPPIEELLRQIHERNDQ